ncbi:hypothetical protein Tco_1310239 [Tanacetum coccineum]
MYIAKIQMVIPAADEDTGPAYDTKPLEKIYVIKGDVDQNTKQHEDKCVLLASLVTNLKLDIDENQKIHKQLKKANPSLAQELKDSKIELERYKTFHTNHKEKEEVETKCKEALGLLQEKRSCHDL